MKKILTEILSLIFFSSLSYGSDISGCANYSHLQCAPSPEFNSCDQEIIDSYVSSLYARLNAHLRGLMPDKDCEVLVDTLKNALQKLPQVEKMRVYRGLGNFQLLDNLQVGECFIDQGFVSTSKSLSVARDVYANKETDVLFQIDIKSGVDITDHSYWREEEVLLLPPVILKLQEISLYQKRKIFIFDEVSILECANKASI
jgi:hypothetical protein